MTTTNAASVLLIYTGGTIGMQEDCNGALKPFDFDSLLQNVPELGKFAGRIDHHTFEPLIDSSDIEPSIWVNLAEIIREKYDEYDGFVILHGTDTMAYSASALSFMLENLGKPVIFTGSQLPIGRPRTDGRENLISSVEIASAKKPDGRARVPEVCICFDSHLLRGNRCIKSDAGTFNAFSSPNYPSLAEAGISIVYNDLLVRRTENAAFAINTSLDTRVSILKLHPGITPQVVRDIMLGSDTRAVIIETYGSGNAMSKEWFNAIVRQSAAMGKILVNVTQCAAGFVDMAIYANGRGLGQAGVISGHDMTTEAALGKLFFLMGQTNDNELVKRQLELDMRGELTL